MTKKYRINDRTKYNQFYPYTPVGFNIVYHYDLELAIAEALKTLETLWIKNSIKNLMIIAKTKLNMVDVNQHMKNG